MRISDWSSDVCSSDLATAQPAQAHPDIWPRYRYPATLTDAQDARVAELLARMTVEEKIGQLVQGDLCCVTPADVRRYHLGSILVGGNSGPHGDDLAPPDRKSTRLNSSH